MVRPAKPLEPFLQGKREAAAEPPSPTD
jgi:hypothetical protein